MFGLQYQSSDNDWEGEVTLSSQDLVNSSALQQVEIETLKECNKPTCSRRLFESQYQSLEDGHSLPGITTVCTTVTSHSPIQSHTSLAGRQYASSATTSTSQTHALNTTSLPNSEDSILSVPISDFSGSVITPTEVLKAIWKKASELLHEPNSLSLAPGQDDKARVVKSYSESRPHLVTRKRSGQYTCDDKCPNWRSLGICAHSVAAAEDNHELLLFVRWFTKAKKVPNITKLATTEMPAGRGHKGSKAPPKKRPKVQPESRTPFSVVSGVQGKRSYHESRTLPQAQVASTSFESVSHSSHSLSMPESDSNRLQGTAAISMSIGSAEMVDTPGHLIMNTGQLNIHSPEVTYHNIPIVSTPPPLLIRCASASPDSSPFTLVFIAGNIRVYRGCRQNIPNQLFPHLIYVCDTRNGKSLLDPREILKPDTEMYITIVIFSVFGHVGHSLLAQCFTFHLQCSCSCSNTHPILISAYARKAVAKLPIGTMKLGFAPCLSISSVLMFCFFCSVLFKYG